MLSSALRALVERAAVDGAFRAQLLANPALAEGLTREQIRALLDEMRLLDGQLSDEVLDQVAGGMTHSGVLGRSASDDPKGCPA